MRELGFILDPLVSQSADVYQHHTVFHLRWPFYWFLYDFFGHDPPGTTLLTGLYFLLALTRFSLHVAILFCTLYLAPLFVVVFPHSLASCHRQIA